jgi:hypothetical protein
MQIRVWHLLSVIIVGAMTAFGPVKSMDWSWISSELDGVRTGLSSWTTLFKSGQDAATSTKPVVKEVPLTPKPASAEATAGKPATEVAAPIVPEVKTVAEAPAPVVEPAPEVKKSAVHSRRRKKGKQVAVTSRRTRGKKTVAKPATEAVVGEKAVSDAPAEVAPAPAAAAGNAEPLVGTYVALQLKSGREVKGVYQGRTATKYKIELPGMGPFEYDAANVAGVKPAE